MQSNDYLKIPRAVGYPRTSVNPLQVPVVICEFHQEVLEFIHRFIASKKLPFSEMLMLHFDSHPDLAFPAQLYADDCKCKQKMYNDLEICDWILPLMYMKHLNRLIWIKPDWAKQIGNINTKFFVGKERLSGKLKVTCTEDYFIEDCSFSPKENLTDISEVEFSVATLPSNKTLENTIAEEKGEANTLTDGKDGSDEKRLMAEELNSNQPTTKKIRHSLVDHLLPNVSNLPKEGEKYILDIDLDFFSVNNPFLKDYTKEEYSLLKEIYYMDLPQSKHDQDGLVKYIEKREKHFARLKEQIYLFSKGIEMGDHLQLTKFLKMIKPRKEKEEDFDWMLVHDAGLSSELPHHVSTEKEIDQLINNAMMFLRELPTPSLVTMARSTEDEYCPPEQIELIQKKVLNMLRMLYVDIDVISDYQDSARLA